MIAGNGATPGRDPPGMDRDLLGLALSLGEVTTIASIGARLLGLG